MGVLKNKSFWVMIFIAALGTFLRLIFIDKPDGLWNDEYISWSIASIPLGKNFINAVLSQCHMPFYYLYLKFFIHFFGSGDLMLRLTSVLTGILSILSMYFVGKEFKDEKSGILCASFTALSSFLIYFSQEVRFYGILFLFASLSLLFTLRLGKKQNLLNLILYVLSNFLIIFTHTIGFVFVLFNLIFVSLWLIKIDQKQKKRIIITWSSLFLLFLLFLPFIYKIFTTQSYSQWWGHFTLSKIGFLITDYFSPVLTNIVSAPDNFFYNFNFGFVIFAIFPSIIAISGIVKALKTREYKIWGLFYVSLAFILVLILSAISGKLVFITKYSIEIYPILIVIVGFGLLEFKKSWRYFLIFLFCFLNLFYILANPNSAPKMHRSEGHKIVANLIKNADLNPGDFILLNYYPQDRFKKYFDFSKYKVISINKANFPDYFGMDARKSLLIGKDIYKNIFKSSDNIYFDKKLENEVISRLKPNQKVSVVILKDVAMYSPMQMQVILGSEKEYNKTPFLFLVFSYLRNETLKDCLENLRIMRIEEKGSWSVITFKKG